MSLLQGPLANAGLNAGTIAMLRSYADLCDPCAPLMLHNLRSFAALLIGRGL